MKALTKFYVKANEMSRGQTMAEYALILAAVAVICVVAYNTMGGDISALLATVDSSL